MSGVCSGQSSARTRGRRAGLWAPRRCAVTLGCMGIVGAHGHRRRHVVTGASRGHVGRAVIVRAAAIAGACGGHGARGHRLSIIICLSVCLSSITYLSTHHPPIIHPSTLGSRFASGQKASGSLSA